jgi:hypothetical protein
VASQPEGVSIPVAFVGVDDTTIQFANQFAVQFEREEIILVVAQFAPPILTGEPDAVMEAARRVPLVPIRVLARYGMPVQRARELATVLQRQLDVLDRTREDTKP